MSGCNAFVSRTILNTAGLKADPQLASQNMENRGTFFKGREKLRVAQHRPATFAAVDFFWLGDAWNPEDPTVTFRTQTLL